MAIVKFVASGCPMNNIYKEYTELHNEKENENEN